MSLYETQQALELRAYIKGKGADISEENSDGGLHVDLAQIIEACDVCLKDDDKGNWLYTQLCIPSLSINDEIKCIGLVCFDYKWCLLAFWYQLTDYDVCVSKRNCLTRSDFTLCCK